MGKEKKKFKIHLTGWWKRLFISRTFKDDLFRRVFREKKALLELYNALNHTHYDNPDELEVTTIESVIYLSMKNDLSFIIGSSMNLYEHQSTVCPNMPVRGLSYFARLYESYISRSKLSIYGTTLLKLPRPQYIVFYNGSRNQPDIQELRLSDAFGPPDKDSSFQEPALECRVQVLNINPGHNTSLVQGCRRLWEYTSFVDEVNRHLADGYKLNDALETAIDACIQKDILKDILIQSRSEVLHMLLTEYNEKEHLKFTFEDGRREGIQQTQAELERILLLNRLLLADNRTEDLKRMSEDSDFRNKLLDEYHL